MAGLARARAQGTRIGRPRATPLPMSAAPGLTVRQAATAWGVLEVDGRTAPTRGCRAD